MGGVGNLLEAMGAAGAVTVGLALPGIAWAWALETRAEGPKWRAALVRTARVVTCGFVMLGMRILVLGSAGRYTRAWDAAATAGLVISGFAIGCWRDRAEVRRGLGPAVLAMGGIAIGVFGIMALPRAGEWIAGGWDPGLYVNEGIAFSRSGTFYPGPDPVLRALPEDALGELTRRIHNYVELLPAVPVDPETSSVTPYFFRMTPMFVAFLHRCGGLRAATRVNYFAGLLAVLLFAAFVARFSADLTWTLGSAAVMLAHPLWLYHLHFPTSEMVQLMLLCAAGLMGPGLPRRRAADLALLAVLFLGMLNRVSFAPFAGMLLVFFAWVEADEADRRAVVWRRVGQAAVLAGGVAFDCASNPVSVGRLRESMPAMLCGFAVLSGCAIALDMGLGRSERLRRFASSWGYCVGLGALAAAVALSFTGRILALGLCASMLRHGTPYLGVCFLLAATLGALWMPRVSEAPGASALRAWSLFLAAATVITCVHPAITGWWPWATRRFVEFTLPWLALCSGLLMMRARQLPWRWSGPMALCLGFVLVACTARRSKAAAVSVEFDGISAALAELAEQIRPEEIAAADHFRWATPLRLAWGRNVFAVDVSSGDPETEARTLRALQVLERAAPSGLLLLASTPEGVGLFPEAFQSAELVWTSQPIAYREVVQHPRARRIRTEEKTKQFRLYRLGPDPEGAGPIGEE